MANIIKASSGLLFSEDFGDDMSLVWSVSPNFPSRVVKNSDSISLLPGTERMELLIPAPDGDTYVLQSDTDYIPTVDTSTGGITLRSVTDSTIDFETIGDDANHFKYSKIMVDNYNVLTALGSIDGIAWQEYGNTKVTNMNKIGYFIGDNSTVDALEINKSVLYKNNSIVFNNFNRKNLIKIYDSLGTEITNSFIIKKRNTQVQIDGTEVLYPIDSLNIQVYDRDTGAILHDGIITDVYGGDIYEYDYDIEFYVNDVLLTNSICDLGSITDGKVFELKVSNKENYDVTDRKLSINYYTYLNPGYQSVDIAPAGTEDYAKDLAVSLTAGETKTFKLKIANYKTYLNLEDEYKFKINFE